MKSVATSVSTPIKASKFFIPLLLAFFFIFPFVSANVVLNLTFDNSSNYSYDSSAHHHFFTNTGGVTFENRSVCKWFGCANFSLTSGDYLNTTAGFDLNSLAVSFWAYHNRETAGSDSMMYFQLGEGSNYKILQQGDYGYSPQWYADSGTVSNSLGGSYSSPANQWEHFFIQYNNDSQLLQGWVNGVLRINSSEPYGNLNASVGDLLKIGAGAFGIDFEGYIDEFLIWDVGDFSDSTVKEIYNAKKDGTPADLDVYSTGYTIPSIEYIYDFSQTNNTLNMSGVLPLTFTISNKGVNNATPLFNVTVYIDGSVLCSVRTSLNVEESYNFTCNMTKSYGLHSGRIVIDELREIGEQNYKGGDLSNNNLTFYVDFRAFPRYSFNATEWKNDLYPYMIDSNNKIAYQIYSWNKLFLADDFDSSWTASNVDPRGVKGYENAVNCYINRYSGSGCDRAWNHLEGWLNGSISAQDYADESVQAIHELSWVAQTFDLLAPNMTQQQFITFGSELQDICEAVYLKSNVRPDLDEDVVSPDNGKGFGMGMATPCEVSLSLSANNPSMLITPSDDYSPLNSVEEWQNRIKHHLAGYLNDSESYMMEGIGYFDYASYHLIQNMWFDYNTNISGFVRTYNNEVCGRAKQSLYDWLDSNYNGQTLRSDRDTTIRRVTYGDSYSYKTMGELNDVGASLISAFGYMCQDQETRNIAKTVRGLLYDRDSNTAYHRPLLDLVYYYYLDNFANNLSINSLNYNHSSSFSSLLDRFVMRTWYGNGWVNDTEIIFDGGEHSNGGHVEADGLVLFVHALGENFIDYPQVNNEDRERSEWWKNTISLQNNNKSGWANTCGYYTLNQYMSAYCDTDKGMSLYPNIVYTEEQYRGDTQDYLANRNAEYGGVLGFKPYVNTSEPVRRYIIKSGNTIVMRDFVNRSVSGLVQTNWLNSMNEFNASISGDSLEFWRVNTSKHLIIDPVTSGLSVGTGNTTFRMADSKTGTPDLNDYYRHSRHYKTTSYYDELFTVRWFEGSDPFSTIELYSSNSDNGSRIDDKYFLFDTNSDNYLSNGVYVSDGWGSYRDSLIIMVFNATYLNESGTNLFESNNSLNVVVNSTSESLSFYINNYEKGLARVSINTSKLTNNSNVAVYKNGVLIPSTSSTLRLSFDVLTDDDGDEFILRSTSPSSNCTPNLMNTSWSSTTYGLCQVTDSQVTSQYLTQYDSNNCAGSTNTTFWNNGTTTCNYCSYFLTQSNYSNWSSSSCGWRSYNEWDSNYLSCCQITGLSSDCYSDDNSTYQGNYSLNETSSCSSSGISSDPIYLNVFLVIAGIALFLLLVGLGANIPFFTIVGFFIIFVLGFVIQAGNLYIPTGNSVESYSYVNGSVSSVETVKEYSAWDSGNYHIIGWFLMIVGLFAFIFSVFTVWGGGY